MGNKNDNLAERIKALMPQIKNKFKFFKFKFHFEVKPPAVKVDAVIKFAEDTNGESLLSLYRAFEEEACAFDPKGKEAGAKLKALGLRLSDFSLNIKLRGKEADAVRESMERVLWLLFAKYCTENCWPDEAKAVLDVFEDGALEMDQAEALLATCAAWIKSEEKRDWAADGPMAELKNALALPNEDADDFDEKKLEAIATILSVMELSMDTE